MITDIQNTKLAIALQPGVFFNSDDFSIRVKEKDKDGVSFKDILIYDRSEMKTQSIGAWSYKKDPRDFKRIIRAEKGKIIDPKNRSGLHLQLNNGFIIRAICLLIRAICLLIGAICLLIRAICLLILREM